MSNINPYGVGAAGEVAAYATESERTGFIRRTYTHLAGAVLAFVALETLLFQFVPSSTMQRLVGMMTGGYAWLLVLGAFMAVGWLARSWANSGQSAGIQYAGLGLYVVAQAVIFLPLLYIAITYVDEQVPLIAGLITVVTFSGLTGFVMVTGVDLASWGKYLALAGLIALALIVCGILFPGISIFGLIFSGAMVALACGYILYDTSNVLHHYRTDQHVAASLALFSSVAFLFWYVIQLVMAFSDGD